MTLHARFKGSNAGTHVNHWSRLLLRLIAVAVCFCTTAAPGCSHRFYLQGPTGGFKAADLNQDGVLSRIERQHVGGDTHNARISMNEDCDGDGVVTWSEYHGSRWGDRRCPWGNSELAPAIDSFAGIEGFKNSLRPRIVHDASVFASKSSSGLYVRDLEIQREYDAMVAGRVANRFERPDVVLRPSEVSFECADSRDHDAEGIATYWLPEQTVLQEGVGPVQRCVLTNNSDESAVAAIAVRISVVVNGMRISAIHTKAVTTEAGSEETFDVLYEPGTTEVDVELIGVKYFAT